MISLVIGIIGFSCALGCVFLFRWIDKGRIEDRAKRSAEDERDRFSEENVVKEQLKFERRLEHNIDLPDGVHGQEAYIYRALMSKWFAVLVAKHHDNESMLRKIRSDWLSYMHMLEHHSMVVGFAAKSSIMKRSAYDRDASKTKKDYMAIEDTFAGEIGKDAVEELQRVRVGSLIGQKRCRPSRIHRYHPSIVLAAISPTQSSGMAAGSDGPITGSRVCSIRSIAVAMALAYDETLRA